MRHPQQLVPFVCHLSPSSTRKHGKWDSNDSLVSMMKCYESLQCARGVCSLTRKWQIDSGRVVAEKAARWRQPRRWKQTQLARPAVTLLFWSFCLYCLSLHCKSAYWLCRGLKNSFTSSAVCVGFLVYVCVSESQRSRYSIRTEQWQRASKDYKKLRIKAYGTHTNTHTARKKCFFLT